MRNCQVSSPTAQNPKTPTHLPRLVHGRRRCSRRLPPLPMKVSQLKKSQGIRGKESLPRKLLAQWWIFREEQRRMKKSRRKYEDAERMLASSLVVRDKGRSFPHVQTTMKKVITTIKKEIYYLTAAVNDRRSAPEDEIEKVSGRANVVWKPFYRSIWFFFLLIVFLLSSHISFPQQL